MEPVFFFRSLPTTTGSEDPAGVSCYFLLSMKTAALAQRGLVEPSWLYGILDSCILTLQECSYSRVPGELFFATCCILASSPIALYSTISHTSMEADLSKQIFIGSGKNFKLHIAPFTSLPVLHEYGNLINTLRNRVSRFRKSPSKLLAPFRYEALTT